MNKFIFIEVILIILSLSLLAEAKEYVYLTMNDKNVGVDTVQLKLEKSQTYTFKGWGSSGIEKVVLYIKETSLRSEGKTSLITFIPDTEKQYELDIIGFKDGKWAASQKFYLKVGLPEGCKENWDCSDWGECTNNLRKKTCKDINSCGTENSKPSEQEECEDGKDEEEQKDEEEDQDEELQQDEEQEDEQDQQENANKCSSYNDDDFFNLCNCLKDKKTTRKLKINNNFNLKLGFVDTDQTINQVDYNSDLTEKDVLILFNKQDKNVYLFPGKEADKKKIEDEVKALAKEFSNDACSAFYKIINSFSKQKIVAAETKMQSDGNCVPLVVHPNGKINYLFVYYGKDDEMRIGDMSFKDFILKNIIGSKEECCGFAYVEPYASQFDKFNFYFVNKPLKKPYYLYPEKDCTEEVRKEGNCAKSNEEPHVQRQNIFELTKNCPSDYVGIIDATTKGKGGGGAVLDSDIYYGGVNSNDKENGLIHIHEFSHIMDIGDEYFFTGGNEVNRQGYCYNGKCSPSDAPNIALDMSEALEKWGRFIGQGDGCLKVLDPKNHKKSTWVLTGGHLLSEYFHATPCSIMNIFWISDVAEYDPSGFSDSLKKMALSKDAEEGYTAWRPTLSYAQVRHGLGPVSEAYVRKRIETI